MYAQANEGKYIAPSSANISFNFKIQQNNEPNASTVGNLLITAFLFAILMTPKAKVTVTTTGRPTQYRVRSIKNAVKQLKMK